MNLASNARLVQVHLNMLGSGDRIASYAAADVLAFLAGQADSKQDVAGIHARPGACRVWFDGLGNNALGAINPGYSVPRGSFVLMANPLGKIEYAGRDQKDRRHQQQPSLPG